MTVTLTQLLRSPVFQELETEVLVEGSEPERQLRAVIDGTAAAELAKAGPDDLVVAEIGDPDDATGDDLVVQAMGIPVAAALVICRGSRRTVPLRLKRAATRWGVTLVAVQGADSAATLIPRLELVLARAETLRLGELERFTHDLLDELRSGHGLSGLVETAAAMLDAPVVLASGTRKIVAMAGLPEGRDVDSVLAEATASVPVTLGGAPWGGLSTTALSASHQTSVVEVLSRLAAVTELELLRSSEVLQPTDRARRELLSDLLNDRATSAGHVLQRAEILGLRLALDEPIIALAVSASAFSRAPLERALQGHGASALWAAFDDDVLIISTTRAGDVPAEAGMRLADTLADMAPTETDETVVALGPVARGVPGAGRALREARSTLAIARSTGVRRRVVTAGMLIVDRLLSRVAEDPEMVRTIEEVLGPLRALRAGRAGTLEETLSAYLDCGGAKTETAHRLGIRRQSLYSRLEQLERLVGPLEDSERRLALHMVVRADRLLRGGSARNGIAAPRSA
jgi:purine catabolism regulator